MSTDFNRSTLTRFSQRKPAVVQLGWWAVTGLTVIFEIATLAWRLPQESKVSLYSTAILQSGLPLGLMRAYYIGVGFIAAGLFLAAGVAIFWRRSDDWIAIWASVVFITGGFAVSVPGYSLALAQPVWRIPYVMLGATADTALLALFFLFPDGRPIPRWIGWLFVPYIAFELYSWTFRIFAPEYWGGTLILVEIAFWGVGVVAQVYRYHRFSNPVQRQQAKWVVYGLALMTLGSLAWILVEPFIFSWSGLPLQLALIGSPLFEIGPFIAPAVAVVFSILRYRLWDIDFIINRSAVYGALTALLIALLGFSLWIMSVIFQNLGGGQQSVIALVVTALAFGAIFQPVRRRLQRIVDERFYQIKIDYQKTPPAGLLSSAGAKTSFGPYRDLELIGRGGMGEVYKTRHPTSNQPVALKLLPAQLAAEGNLQQRFQREAKIATGLRHPNIVQVFDSGEVNGVGYLAMEYINGKDLGAHLQKDGRWSLTAVLPIFQGIAAALDYAHQQGLVHRDIKPSNVMLDEVRPVLTDFGIAKVLGGTALTQTGGMLGTLDYIAPEQIQAVADISGRADVYAFGVMAYQMLTGELPFQHSNAGALLIAHLSQPPPDARGIEPALSSAAAQAIQRAMAKAPEERQATAGEFVGELGPEVISDQG